MGVIGRVLLVLALGVSPAAAQQVADRRADISVAAPAYARDGGPLVLIDEAHANVHTAGGRYAPFAAVLRNDGYRVRGLTSPLTPQALQGASVLVVANPLHPSNVNNWKKPTPPAFTPEEAEAVKGFVREGGSLWLIVDHMPFPGAAEPLARAFGFEFVNGFVVQRAGPAQPDYFRAADRTLLDHPVVQGRNPRERISSVRTFTGSAFKAPAAARPILRLGGRYIALEPEQAWAFTAATPTRTLDAGWSQGATLVFGRGRVAVFGEAAMFTAQLAGGQPTGFSAPDARQNKQFLLNLAHWLTSVLPGQ
jgi:hypothetical protein